jgi:hypothetical protein
MGLGLGFWVLLDRATQVSINIATQRARYKMILKPKSPKENENENRAS